MSFAPEVIADGSGKWCGNALRFATREEAEQNVAALADRWFMVRDTRVVESADAVNYCWVDGGLVAIEKEAALSLISAPEPFTFKRRPARMYVVHNDGFCWGRMVVEEAKGLVEYDVPTRRDYYDRCYEDAVTAFINAAKRGKAEEPMSSWRIEADD